MIDIVHRPSRMPDSNLMTTSDMSFKYDGHIESAKLNTFQEYIEINFIRETKYEKYLEELNVTRWMKEMSEISKCSKFIYSLGFKCIALRSLALRVKSLELLGGA